MQLDCLLLNITLRDLPRKCEKMRKMRKNADYTPPAWKGGGSQEGPLGL